MKVKKFPKTGWRQWWRWRQDPWPFPGALHTWWATFGWLSPSARNLFFTSLAVVPATLVDATLLAGMDSFPSVGNQGRTSLTLLSCDWEPSTWTVGAGVALEGCPAPSTEQVGGQWPHLP